MKVMSSWKMLFNYKSILMTVTVCARAHICAHVIVHGCKSECDCVCCLCPVESNINTTGHPCCCYFEFSTAVGVVFLLVNWFNWLLDVGFLWGIKTILLKFSVCFIVTIIIRIKKWLSSSRCRILITELRRKPLITRPHWGLGWGLVQLPKSNTVESPLSAINRVSRGRIT